MRPVNRHCDLSVKLPIANNNLKVPVIFNASARNSGSEQQGLSLEPRKKLKKFYGHDRQHVLYRQRAESKKWRYVEELSEQPAGKCLKSTYSACVNPWTSKEPENQIGFYFSPDLTVTPIEAALGSFLGNLKTPVTFTTSVSVATSQTEQQAFRPNSASDTEFSPQNSDLIRSGSRKRRCVNELSEQPAEKWIRVDSDSWEILKSAYEREYHWAWVERDRLKDSVACEFPRFLQSGRRKRSHDGNPLIGEPVIKRLRECCTAFLHKKPIAVFPPYLPKPDDLVTKLSVSNPN